MKKTSTKFKPYTSINIHFQNFKEINYYLEEVLKFNIDLSPRLIDKKIVLYGAGKLGNMAKDFFNYLNIPFLYFVDKNAENIKSNSEWKKTKILLPNEVKKEDKKNCLLIICTVTTPLIALKNYLELEGWEDIAFFYDICETYKDKHPLNNGWFIGEINNEELENIKKIFSILDFTSKKYYLQFLTWRKLRIELIIQNLKINLTNRFFIPEVINTLTNNEIFIDCGAHTGSITDKFIDITKGKYDKIYGIESDLKNFNILKDNMKNINNIELIHSALSDYESKSNFFQGFDYASKISENGKHIVNVIKLDSLKINATYIKMHLEGEEYNALKGSIDTIKKNRPILAITIYHNSDGIWRIPQYLINSIHNYKYYIRLDSFGGTGIVLYGIPKERNKVKK